MVDARDREVARLNGVYERLLAARGVEIVRGRAALVDPHTVEVTAPDGAVTRRRARYVLVATGGRPLRPDFPGADLALCSDDVFRLREVPRRLLVVGGGYIAVEMAGIFHGYGAAVTVAHRGELPLRGFDGDVRQHLASEMRRRGVDLRAATEIVHLSRRPDGALDAVLSTGDTLTVDAVLAAVGRAPNTAGLGLEAAGVALDDRGAVKVDARFRTSARGVYAVGDVIDRVQLTPAALAEGMLVAQNLFGAAPPRGFSYDAIPSAVFSTPPVGTVGLTEAEARAEARGDGIDVFVSAFTPLRHTVTGRTERTFMKLVVDRASQRVVGVHVVGPEAGEIVQGFAVAVKLGATKAQFDATLGIHPTAAEELVTMREPRPEPVAPGALEETPPRRFAHHRWDDADE
jgi:glutathione reductase (NADPH)